MTKFFALWDEQDNEIFQQSSDIEKVRQARTDWYDEHNQYQVVEVTVVVVRGPLPTALGSLIKIGEDTFVRSKDTALDSRQFWNNVADLEDGFSDSWVRERDWTLVFDAGKEA